MHARSRTWLEDILTACQRIQEATSGQSLITYKQSWQLRAATERMFEIIGEALARLERSDRDLIEAIPDYRQIIGFRNRIAHGYDDIRDEQVWEIIHTFLPQLKATVERLLHDDP